MSASQVSLGVNSVGESDQSKRFCKLQLSHSQARPCFIILLRSEPDI